MILIRALIWAILGCIYGLAYILVTFRIPSGIPPSYGLVATSVAATTFVALLYGSMRLTVIAAIYTSIAIVIAFLTRADLIRLDVLILVGTLTGAAVGAVYGWRVKSSRIYCADAKTIAGVSAGLLASLSLVLPCAIGVPLPLGLEIALTAPLSGLLYVSLAPSCVRCFSHLLSPPADGALVGAGVGLLMAMLFWTMGGTLEGYLNPSDQLVVNRITTQLPAAILAAGIAAGTIGALRALLNVRWLDL